MPLAGVSWGWWLAGLRAGRAGRVVGGAAWASALCWWRLWRVLRCAVGCRSCRRCSVCVWSCPVGRGLLAAGPVALLAVLRSCLSAASLARVVFGLVLSGFSPEFPWIFGVGHFWRSSKTPFHCDSMD